MSGEITLRECRVLHRRRPGESVAAYRLKLSTVILRRRIADLADVPAKASMMDLRFVRHMDDVLRSPFRPRAALSLAGRDASRLIPRRPRLLRPDPFSPLQP
jgi:hypothetical protein